MPDSDLNSVEGNQSLSNLSNNNINNNNNNNNNKTGELALYSNSNGSNDNLGNSNRSNNVIQGEEGTTKMNYLLNTPSAANRCSMDFVVQFSHVPLPVDMPFFSLNRLFIPTIILFHLDMRCRPVKMTSTSSLLTWRAAWPSSSNRIISIIIITITRSNILPAQRAHRSLLPTTLDQVCRNYQHANYFLLVTYYIKLIIVLCLVDTST